MKLEIRKATVNDSTTLALLAQITFKEAFGHFWSDRETLKKYFKKTFAVEKMRSSLEKENNVFWIAFADELPVGYAKLKKYSPFEKLEDKRPAQLQKIYILNQYIGHKIGTQLQDVLFDEVRKLNIKSLWLVVWDENDKGIRFYERHGFIKIAKHQYSFEHMEIDYEIMTKTF